MIKYISTLYLLPQVLLACHRAIAALQQFQCWQQFRLRVSSNMTCRVWSLLVPVTTGEGCALHLQCSEADGDPQHSQHPLGWAGHHRPLSRLALQSQPYRACLPVYVLLLLVLFWFLNHCAGESIWALENCSSAEDEKERPYAAATVRGYVYPGGLGTLERLWMT